jgi:hypothetical protein
LRYLRCCLLLLIYRKKIRWPLYRLRKWYNGQQIYFLYINSGYLILVFLLSVQLMEICIETTADYLEGPLRVADKDIARALQRVEVERSRGLSMGEETEERCRRGKMMMMMMMMMG